MAAFDKELTRREHRELMQAYRRAGIKRYHYTNSGTLESRHVRWLISYYTFILDYYEIDAETKEVYMRVNPYVFLKDEYRSSPTTTRQANRWLAENGFEFSVQGLAHVYDNAVNGIASHPMTRTVDGITTFVVPRFSGIQIYLTKDGACSNERATSKVPYLRYDDHQSSLVRAGWAISDGNTLGIKYE